MINSISFDHSETESNTVSALVPMNPQNSDAMTDPNPESHDTPHSYPSHLKGA